MAIVVLDLRIQIQEMDGGSEGVVACVPGVQKAAGSVQKGRGSCRRRWRYCVFSNGRGDVVV